MRYLVESYLPAVGGAEHKRVAARARDAAAELARAGAALHYLDAIFVPEDEMCLFVFEADSPELVREAGRRAGFSVERVLEAVGMSTDPT